MTATLTETSTPNYYEVVFGPNERDRQTYIDYKDGSLLSERAEVMATRTYLQMVTDGVRCGFWANGVLTAGEDTTDEPEPEPVEHKTRTFDPRPETGTFDKRGRPVRDKSACAICSCGWSSWEANRELARREAKRHREEEAA